MAVDILLLHYTGMMDGQAALARLTDPSAKVSAHYTVGEDGTIWRHVPETQRAWHAGVSHWAGDTDINARSIGIELVNPGHEFGYRAFPAAQIAALIELCRAILARHPIPAHRVLGHSDVAPSRKIDPGELFPWAHLAACGIGLWPDSVRRFRRATLKRGSEGPAVRRLKARLAAFGYGVSEGASYDAETALVVAAFQRHFRPSSITGEADGETLGILSSLLRKVSLWP